MIAPFLNTRKQVYVSQALRDNSSNGCPVSQQVQHSKVPSLHKELLDVYLIFNFANKFERTVSIDIKKVRNINVKL